MRNSTLDGVRGLAIVLVLLYHAGYLNSGWVGVDLFFVLSGYLITRILRKSNAAKSYWRQFWIKRSLRILPPLLLALISTSLFGLGLSFWHASLYLLSLGDLMAYLNPRSEPLRPLWSLAVEEHFYVLWPIAVRCMSRRHLLTLASSIVIAEPFVRAATAAHVHSWELIYFLTPFRLDGLSLGSTLALLMEDRSAKDTLAKWSSTASVFCLLSWFVLRLTLGISFTRNNPGEIYEGACYSIVSLGAFFVIAYLAIHQNSLVAKVLSLRPLTHVGTISYGIYLYQGIIREIVLKTFGKGVISFCIEVPVVLIVSDLSFRLVERPLMECGRRTLMRSEKSVHEEATCSSYRKR